MIILRIVKTSDDMEKAIPSSLDCHQIFLSSRPLVFNISVSYYIPLHCSYSTYPENTRKPLGF